MTDWITTEEAAALAHVRPDTLRHYARDGRAPQPRRFGRALMWNRDDLLAWLRTRPGQGARTDLRPPRTRHPPAGDGPSS